MHNELSYINRINESTKSSVAIDAAERFLSETLNSYLRVCFISS